MSHTTKDIRRLSNVVKLLMKRLTYGREISCGYVRLEYSGRYQGYGEKKSTSV